MENNIEEDITKIDTYIELVLEKDYCNCNELNTILGKHCDGSKNVAYAMQHILSEYKRVLKENEELQEDRNKFKKALGKRITYCNELEKDLFENGSNYVIPKQKVKEKIEELEEEIKPKQDIHQKLCIEVNKIGTETEYDYAMEELSILDDELREMLIKKRVLQELLEESEE